MKYKRGIIIGRFQPFHNGHKFLIEEALKQCKKIIIGIGNAEGKGENNPLDWRERKKILEKFVDSEKIKERVLMIIPLVNNPSDQIWLENLIKQTGSVDVVIGNNEWVNGIFENAKIPAIRPGHLDRERLEGTKIRGLIREGKKWEDRVPSYLVPLVKKASSSNGLRK